MRLRYLLLLLSGAALGLIALSVACGGSESGGKTVEKVFSPQDNELDLYDVKTDEKTILIPNTFRNVDGQACAMPGDDGRFLIAEDIYQNQGARQGWQIFSADGQPISKILEPVTEGEKEQIEPYGCVFDNDERLFVTEVGNEDFTGGNGKLIIFYPPDYSTYCVLTHTLRVSLTVALDDDGSVLVAQAVPPGQILRFSPPFPKDPTECATVQPKQSVFLQDPELQTPSGIARAPNGNWYVSSVFVPTAINEYDHDGKLVRKIISGDDIGNPQGVAVASDGTIYYADLGLVTKPGELPGPEPGKGTVRKVTFDAQGNPQPPVVIGSGYDFPDAVSILKVKE
jgi:hypothetical protein